MGQHRLPPKLVAQAEILQDLAVKTFSRSRMELGTLAKDLQTVITTHRLKIKEIRENWEAFSEAVDSYVDNVAESSGVEDPNEVEDIVGLTPRGEPVSLDSDAETYLGQLEDALVFLQSMAKSGSMDADEEERVLLALSDAPTAIETAED